MRLCRPNAAFRWARIGCAWPSMATSWTGAARSATAPRSPSSRRSAAGRDVVVKRFSLSDAPFEIEPLRKRLLDHRAGAYVGFEGWVRNVNEGRLVLALTYEAYAALAEDEGERILDEACS